MLRCDSFTTFVAALIFCTVVAGAPCLHDTSQEDNIRQPAGFDYVCETDLEAPLPLNQPEDSLAVTMAARDLMHICVIPTRDHLIDTPIEYDPVANFSVHDMDFEIGDFSVYRTEEPVEAAAAESAKKSKKPKPIYHSGQIESTRNMTISGFSILSLPVTIGLIGAGAAGIGISRIRRRRRP